MDKGLAFSTLKAQVAALSIFFSGENLVIGPLDCAVMQGSDQVQASTLEDFFFFAK